MSLEKMYSEILLVYKGEGIEQIANEDLARRLDISQAQASVLFADKAELVRQVVQQDLKEQEQHDKELLKNAANPVEEIILLLQDGIQKLKEVNPAYILDLQQYYPNIWQLCLDHLSSYNYYLNLDVINRGILQGYFRKDINLQLVVKIILEQFNMLINPAVFPPERYDMGEVFRSIYLYYVRGICTEQGSRLAEEYFSRNNI